jgi:UDP-N-acetylglucosamine 2-epimerase (non-hydrolysing)
MSSVPTVSSGVLPKGGVLCVVGARPNYMKMAPLLRAMANHVPALPTMLVHTGQHYERNMNERFFDALQLPPPAVNLGVGSGSHASQTADIMRRFEPVLQKSRAACVAVVGDVNSTLACALVAAKQGVPVVHVEAGLRSFDRSMPEEINRVLTDQLADRLYTTERSASANLVREGVAPERICFAGNVMIDSVVYNLPQAKKVSETLRNCHVDPQLLNAETDADPDYDRDHDPDPGYGLVTLHRPSNVDSGPALQHLVQVLCEVARDVPLVFVVHPRTRLNLQRFGLMDLIDPKRLVLLPAQGYLEMLGLLSGAKLVLTDSGGLQEESTALDIACLTLRDNTERPITVEQGSNTLVGHDRERILHAVHAVLAGRGKHGQRPELWDGQAAVRIAADLYRWLHTKPVTDVVGGA